jgi:hypothetical protein
MGALFEPENKRQLMAYRHKVSPSPEKFKIAPAARNVMFIVYGALMLL